MNRTSLSLRATRRTRSSPLDALCPALSPERVEPVAFPSGDPLPSTTSATPTGALFSDFAGTTGSSDFPRSCITGLRPQPFPHDPPLHHDRRMIMGSPGSRIRRFRTCPGSSTPRSPSTARENAANDVAFRVVGPRRHPEQKITRLNSPACTYPTDASPPPSRTTTHGSGPPRLATPSMLDSLIPFSRPDYPGAPYTDFLTPSGRSEFDGGPACGQTRLR